MVLLLRASLPAWATSGEPRRRRHSFLRSLDKLTQDTSERRYCGFHLHPKCSHSSQEISSYEGNNLRPNSLIKSTENFWEAFVNVDLQKVVNRNFGIGLLLSDCVVVVVPSPALAEACEGNTPFSNMPVLFAIAMIGATVGGVLARQRRGELQRLNDQLRQINAALRRQAKIESYAPALSYAPVGKVQDSDIIVDPQKDQIIAYLRNGKNHLRNQTPEKALTEFKTALQLAKSVGDHVEEKKAARGVGASLQRLGKYKEAIQYHKAVLDISAKTGEDAGCTEAYGAIADCYTELGELEQAGKFYDRYIARLESD